MALTTRLAEALNQSSGETESISAVDSPGPKSIGTFFKTKMSQKRSLIRRISTLALVLLGSLAADSSLAQTCIRCPNNANDVSLGPAFRVFIHRNGVDENVSGQFVG